MKFGVVRLDDPDPLAMLTDRNRVAGAIPATVEDVSEARPGYLISSALLRFH